MQNERWVPIVGYEGIYSVSDRGQVRSEDRTTCQGYKLTGRVRKLVFDKDGYARVGLYLDGRTYTTFVHTLVCTAFNGARPHDKLQVRHLDGDKTNNTPDNLAWGTCRENILDKHRHGLTKVPYFGVTPVTGCDGKYQTTIYLQGGKRKYLGVHDCPVKAAGVFDAYVLEHKLDRPINNVQVA